MPEAMELFLTYFCEAFLLVLCVLSVAMTMVVKRYLMPYLSEVLPFILFGW